MLSIKDLVKYNGNKYPYKVYIRLSNNSSYIGKQLTIEDLGWDYEKNHGGGNIVSFNSFHERFTRNCFSGQTINADMKNDDYTWFLVDAHMQNFNKINYEKMAGMLSKMKKLEVAEYFTMEDAILDKKEKIVDYADYNVIVLKIKGEK